jgi:hypothetical protein
MPWLHQQKPKVHAHGFRGGARPADCSNIRQLDCKLNEWEEPQLNLGSDFLGIFPSAGPAQPSPT